APQTAGPRLMSHLMSHLRVRRSSREPEECPAEDAPMIHSTSDRAIRYVAHIQGAQEVTLAGAADWGYWKGQLARVGLFPYRVNGRAELHLSATALRWKGLRFHELVVALGVSGRDGSSRDGAYLFAAFNTSRMLAFCERVFFRTPSQHGNVTL